jgi:hypothetical protein
LIVEDSEMWMAIPFAVAALIALVVTIVTANLIGLAGVVLFLLFAIPPARKTTFVFDARRRVVRWKRRKLFKIETGRIPFDDINEIDTEAIFGDKATAYRLKIITPQGFIPMAYTFGAGGKHYEQLRETIMDVVRSVPPPVTSAEPGAKSDEAPANLDPSIRLLLIQGRKVDAVSLLCSTHNLSLTQATEQIDEIDRKMKANA